MTDEQKARIESALEGITMTVDHVPTTAEKVRDLTLKYNVTIAHEGRRILTSEYSMGIGLIPGIKSLSSLVVDDADYIRSVCRTGKHYPGDALSWPHERSLPLELRARVPLLPTLADVMYCLIGDASAIDHATFEDWAADYGYDTDSRKAEKTYRACLETGLKLRAALGEARLQQIRDAFHDY